MLINDLKDRQLLALKLLGVESQRIDKNKGISLATLAELRGTSIATVPRHINNVLEKVTGGVGSDKYKLLSKQKNAVKHVAFQQLKDKGCDKKNITQIQKKITKVLTSNYLDYISLIWFGNIANQPAENNLKIIDRVFVPKDPSKKLSYHKPYQPRPDNRINERLANMPSVLQLLNLNDNNIELFANSLKVEDPLIDIHLSSKENDLYKLHKVASRYPATTKQKERKTLISFAIKHLERNPSNFIYMQKFKVHRRKLSIIDGKPQPYPSWWVYGHKDILDWYECAMSQ